MPDNVTINGILILCQECRTPLIVVNNKPTTRLTISRPDPEAPPHVTPHSEECAQGQRMRLCPPDCGTTASQAG